MRRIKSKDIIAARQALKITQEQLAKEVGTTQQHVSKWEKGMIPRNAWQALLQGFFKKHRITISY